MRILLDDIAIYRRVKMWDKKNSYGYAELTGLDISQEDGDFPEVENLPFTSEILIATSTDRAEATYFPCTSEQLVDIVSGFNCHLFGKPSKRNMTYSLGSTVTDFICVKYIESIRYCQGYAIEFENGQFKSVKKKEKADSETKVA